MSGSGQLRAGVHRIGTVALMTADRPMAPAEGATRNATVTLTGYLEIGVPRLPWSRIVGFSGHGDG